MTISSFARSSGKSAGHIGFAPRSSSLPVSHFERYETMRHIPRGMPAKSISAIGRVSSPRIATLTSRPSMKRCTSISSQPSNIASTLALRARMLRTTERCSIPTDASSAAGLMIAGNPTLVTSSPFRRCEKRGTGSPARSRTRLTRFFRSVRAAVQLELPVNGTPRSSRTEITIGSQTASPSIPSHRLKTRSNFPLRTRSTQRPSRVTGTRTTSSAQSRSAVSTASIESSSCTSGALPRAESPSNSNAIFIARPPSRSSRQPARDQNRLAHCCSATGAKLHTLSRGSVLQTTLNELVVADPGRARRFRQARVVGWVRQNPRKRIHLDHVRSSRGIQANIDPRPVAAAEHTERIECNSLNRRLKLLRDTRRTLKNFQRFLGTIPDELRIEAVDGQSTAGKRLEIHPDDRKNRRFLAVAKNSAGEFLPGQIFLDENWLLVALQQEGRLSFELRPVSAEVAVADSLR